MPEFTDTNQPSNENKSEAVAKSNVDRRLVSNAIIVALKREALGIDDGKPTRKLNNIATKLVDMAENGDLGAMREVMDRTEGKAMQAIELAGAGGGALIVQIGDKDAGTL